MERNVTINDLGSYMDELIGRYGFAYSEYGDETILKVPEYMGVGYIKTIDVSPDIYVGIMDLDLNTPLITYYDDYSNTCEVTYCSSGYVSYTEVGVNKASLKKNQMGIYSTPQSRGMTLIPSDQRVHLVSIVSKSSFQEQLPYYDLCKDFDECIIREMLYKMAVPKKVDAKLYNQFDRILNNCIGGSLKNTYIDSLGKVILVDLWHDNVESLIYGKKNHIKDDFRINALLEAKNILTNDFISPPTIQELSRMVALNECSLKSGFKELFGRSIYEFARYRRMENARYLLENGSNTIGQVASMVGYSNASHFARAFRNEYGVNPKDFRGGF